MFGGIKGGSVKQGDLYEDADSEFIFDSKTPITTTTFDPYPIKRVRAGSQPVERKNSLSH